MKFKNLKLSSKQFLGFGVILMIFAAVHYYTINRMGFMNTAIAEFNENWLPRAIAISNINGLASELRLNQLQYAFAKDEKSKKEQTQNMINIIDQINKNLDNYTALKKEFGESGLSFEKEKNIFELFDQKWDNYQELSFQFFWLLEEDKRQEAIFLLTSEARLVYNEFRKDLNDLVDLYEEAVLTTANRSALTFKATRGLTTLLMFLAIGFSVFFAVILIRLIVIPVKQLEKATSLVADGDLKVQLTYESKDEIGSMATSFNRMTASLLAAREETEMQSAKLRMQWDVLRETNGELEQKSHDLLKQKTLIEKKNNDLETALKRLKNTQNQLVQSEKMASLGQLTAGIAHEINNPINFVAANVNPLRNDIEEIIQVVQNYDKTIASHNLGDVFNEVTKQKEFIDYRFVLDEVKNLLDGMEEGARRTKEIVSGLRNFSRLDEEDMKLADINMGIESTLLMLRNQLKDRIEIEKDFQDMPHVLCFPGKLNQVFMNIISNSSQAIEGKGKIRIKSRIDKNKIMISISDNGKGMSKEIQKRIFEPFFTTKDIGEGTGLGLSISYGIIKDHEGEILVKSDKRKGTEFTIIIPAKQ